MAISETKILCVAQLIVLRHCRELRALTPNRNVSNCPHPSLMHQLTPDVKDAVVTTSFVPAVRRQYQIM